MTYVTFKCASAGKPSPVMTLLLPDEIAKSVIPAIRAMVVRRLVDKHGMTQQQAAQLLEIAQPAVSKYMHKKRGIAIRPGRSSSCRQSSKQDRRSAGLRKGWRDTGNDQDE